MAKDKDRALNPAAAQHKADKQKALKKGKAAVQAQRMERLAQRNPNRLERQITELKALQSGSVPGTFSIRDKNQLEELERDLGRIKKAREVAGTKAPTFGRKNDERGNTGNKVLGKRARDWRGEGDVKEESSGGETDESVRRIPMPRDTPPPLSAYDERRRNHRRGGQVGGNANLEPLGHSRVAEEKALHQLPSKPEVAARTTYEAKAMVKDLRKEAIKAFVPNVVARKAAAAKGGVTERLLKEEEVDKLEREGYREHKRENKGEEVDAGEAVDNAPPRNVVESNLGEDEQTRLDAAMERFSREVHMEEVSDDDL